MSTRVHASATDNKLLIEVAARAQETISKSIVPLEEEYIKKTDEPVWKRQPKISPYYVIRSEFDAGRGIIAHSILELQHRVRSLFDDAQQKLTEPVRGFEPVHVMIEGVGGSGKSVFTTFLTELINALDCYAFLRPAIEKFGDDIAEAQLECESKGTFFMLLVMDDLYINREDPADAQTLMTIVNSSATPLIIRDKALSGTVVKPLFVISTTNNPYPRSSIDAGALSRRVHRRILLRDGVMFCKDTGTRVPLTQVALFDWMIQLATSRLANALKQKVEIANFAHAALQMSLKERKTMAIRSLKASMTKVTKVPQKPKELNPILMGGLSVMSSLLD